MTQKDSNVLNRALKERSNVLDRALKEFHAAERDYFIIKAL
jgi:hypothetical protein